MKWLYLVVAPLALAGCPQDNLNPPAFWLAQDGPSELRVLLAPIEPVPF
jgi:hypothetical protein